jgi:mercuric ion binding protein
MKLQKIIFLFAIVVFLTVGCKNQTEKTDAGNTETEKEMVAANPQKVALTISGMTCEIGCAKFIQSKLSKKDGVLDAKVVFNDSIANVEFDANKTSKEDLISMVNGLADGDLYKASEKNK